MFCWPLLIVPWLHKLMSHSHFKTPPKKKKKKVPFQFGGSCEPFKAILKTVYFSIALSNKRFFPISFIIYTVLCVSLSLSFTLNINFLWTLFFESVFPNKCSSICCWTISEPGLLAKCQIKFKGLHFSFYNAFLITLLIILEFIHS